MKMFSHNMEIDTLSALAVDYARAHIAFLRNSAVAELYHSQCTIAFADPRAP